MSLGEGDSDALSRTTCKKIQALPEPLARLVDLFVEFLLARYRQRAKFDDELDADLLTQIVINGHAFDWLNDPAEEGIYSDADGEPI
jgi:hypothetical protein